MAFQNCRLELRLGVLWSLSKVFVVLLVEGIGLCIQFLASSAMSNDILKSAGGFGPPEIVIKRHLTSLALSRRSTKVRVERPLTSLVHILCKDGLPYPHHA
ncbi:hypothetical protein PRUPE_5G010300 [Prunus persica]|uniref:Uncharacterized protein n=1 Tax=Prunus persica TaxID=3760 RepID=A0A251P1K7_PRUPE|nr:hypothetical protein PRUPE_5G010300 [Prunus persica]